MIDVVAWTATARARTPEHLRALAAALAPLARPGDVILLVGGLGAGKTTFAQGFARGLGIAGPVTSPTFTLVRQYACAGTVRQLLHADVYRLDTLAEVADLGLGELVEDGGVALVEWGDAAEPVLGAGALKVSLTLAPPPDDEVRLVTVTRGTATWSDRRGAIERVIADVSLLQDGPLGSDGAELGSGASRIEEDSP